MAYNRTIQHFTTALDLVSPWATGRTYAINELVLENNTVYICLATHTSGTFNTDLAAGRWKQANPLTTAGDIMVYNGTDSVRLPVGTDGQVLVADSGQTNKLKWSTAPSGNLNYITNGGAEANNTTGWATYAESDAVTFQDAGDTVTLNNHGLSNGNIVSFTSITSTTGISVNTSYFVVGATTNTFQVASSAGGSALPLTTNGSGTLVRFAPKTASGGVANVTISATGTTPLIGTYSFLMAKDAANRQGEGWVYDFTIDSAYRAKVLQISFQYLVNSGTFSAGTSTTNSDVTIWIYDVTNGVLIQPSSNKLLSNSTTITDTFNATFQTASNSSNYRLIFHVATTSASAYTLEVDGITVSPSTYVYGTPVTDWASYTPTLTGFGTATNVQFQWRRVGDNVEVRGKFTSGTPTATEARATLPLVTSADTGKIPSLQLVGMAATSGTASNSRTVLIEPSVGYVTFGITTSGPLTKANGSSVVAASETISFFALVPVQGWSSSVQTSDQTDTRVVAAAMKTTATLSTTSGSALLFTGTNFDTHAAYNSANGRYTCPVSGIYTCELSGLLTTATKVNFSVFKNGSFYNKFAGVAVTTGDVIGSGAIDIECNAGDYLTIVPDQSTTLLYNASLYVPMWNVRRLSGPSAIAASETVAAKYSGSIAATASTTAPIQWNTKQYDTHNAVTTGANWRFTAPISGVYRVGLVVYSSSGAQALYIYKNGSSTATRIGDVNNTQALFSGGTVSLLSGDYIDIRPGGSISIFGLSELNISIERIGNYA